MTFIVYHKWKIIIALVIVLAVLIASLISIQVVNRNKVEEYKTSMKKNWDLISDKAEAFTAELNGVKSISDLNGLREIAEEFRDTIDSVYRSIEKNPPPSSLNDLYEKELDALNSISGYLDSLIELSGEEQINNLENKRAVFENRAGKAYSDYNEFIKEADFLNPGISTDTFNGLKILSEAANYHGENYKMDSAEVYEALKVFLDADIIEPNGAVLWGMTAAERRSALESLGGNPDNMLQYRDAQWEDSAPEGYYISKSSVAFSSPGVAEADVVVYMKKGISKKGTVQLVLEPDGWKISVYPFFGWLE